MFLSFFVGGTEDTRPGEETWTMALGTVKCFDHSKGFGWIQERSGREVFVHFSAIREDGFRTLAEGEEVEFEVRETDRGPHAHNVFRH